MTKYVSSEKEEGTQLKLDLSKKDPMTILRTLYALFRRHKLAKNLKSKCMSLKHLDKRRLTYRVIASILNK